MGSKRHYKSFIAIFLLGVILILPSTFAVDFGYNYLSTDFGGNTYVNQTVNNNTYINQTANLSDYLWKNGTNEDTNLTIGHFYFIGDGIKAYDSAGGYIKSSSGSNVAQYGMGGGQAWTFFDGVKLDGRNTNEILSTDSNSNIVTTGLNTSQLCLSNGTNCASASVNLSGYATLNGSNQPFTGDINITKTNATLNLVDTTSNRNLNFLRNNTGSYIYSRHTPTASGYAINTSSTSTSVAAFSSSPCAVGGNNQVFTISVWANTRSTSSAAQGIINCDINATYKFHIHLNIDNTATASITNSGGYIARKQGSTAANSWKHYVAKVNATSLNIEFFINNVNATGAAGGLFHSTTNNLGNYFPGTYNYPFLGLIDQFAIWNGTLLNSTQITNLYNAGSGIAADNSLFPANATGVWNLDEGTGSTSSPYIGSGSLTLTSVTWATGLIPPTGVNDSDYPVLTIVSSGVAPFIYNLTLGQSASYNFFDSLVSLWRVSSVQSMLLNTTGLFMSTPIFAKAGTTSANSAPLYIPNGSLMSSAEKGAIENLNDKIYFTINTSTARKELTLNDVALTSGRLPYTTTNGRITDTGNLTFNGTTMTLTGNMSDTYHNTTQTAYTRNLQVYNQILYTNLSGYTGTITVVCTVDFVGLTSTSRNLTYTLGGLTNATACA